jgi:phosphoribulokinase
MNLLNQEEPFTSALFYEASVHHTAVTGKTEKAQHAHVMLGFNPHR